MTIDVYLISRDLLSPLRSMVADIFRFEGGGRIIVVDNASTYPPLLDWYSSDLPANVELVRLTENIGPHGVWKHIDTTRQYAVSDSDLDLGGVPNDVLHVLTNALARYPDVCKAGLSLELPPAVPLWADTRARQVAFWADRVDGRFYYGNIDTTFALHRRGTTCWPGYFALRADRPYTTVHLPWAWDPQNLTPEQTYYLEHKPYGHGWCSERLRAAAGMLRPAQ